MTMDQPDPIGAATGQLGVVGVFVPEDPQAPDPLSREGRVAFDWGFCGRGGQVSEPGKPT